MNNDFPLVLIGPMASGKSTIGALLANLLGVRHYDTDAELVKKHGAINNIFTRHGEETFRMLEKQCAQEILDLPQKNIVSLGGGAPSNLHEKLKKNTVIYLETTWHDIAQRLTEKEIRTRPMLRQYQLETTQCSWENLLQEREDIYQKLATITVSVRKKTPEEITSEIIQKLITCHCLEATHINALPCGNERQKP